MEKFWKNGKKSPKKQLTRKLPGQFLIFFQTMSRELLFSEQHLPFTWAPGQPRLKQERLKNIATPGLLAILHRWQSEYGPATMITLPCPEKALEWRQPPRYGMNS